MIFSVTAIDPTGQTRQFTYSLDSLESNLNFIYQIRTGGDLLLGVELFDENGITDLPLETFDGVSATTTLDELETEWKAILAR